MQAWRITAPRNIEMYESKSGEVTSPELVRVKIEMSAVTHRDLSLYKKGASSPIIPGRLAAGVISEAHPDDTFFTKSERVVIDPVIPCGKCIECRTGHSNHCPKKTVLGLNHDGLHTDFITLPVDAVHKLPPTVSFETALFTEYIAIALNALDKIDIKKGDHVAILAANKLGYVIAQLVAYYQAIPVVIDVDDVMLAYSKEAGVPYIFNPDKTNVRDEVVSITGGRLCEKVIYLTNTPKSINTALSVCAYNGIICAVGYEEADVQADFAEICKKQLTICTMDSGTGAFSSAINLLATKAVKIQDMLAETVAFDNLGKVYEETDSSELIFKTIPVKV